MKKIAFAVLVLGTAPAYANDVSVQCQITNDREQIDYSDGNLSDNFPGTNPGTTETYTLTAEGLKRFSNVQITRDKVTWDVAITATPTAAGTIPATTYHTSIDRHTGAYSETNVADLGDGAKSWTSKTGICHKAEGF